MKRRSLNSFSNRPHLFFFVTLWLLLIYVWTSSQVDIVDIYHDNKSRLRILVTDHDEKSPILIRELTISESDKLIHKEGAIAQSRAIARIAVPYKTECKTPAPSRSTLHEEHTPYTLWTMLSLDRTTQQRVTSIEMTYPRTMSALISTIQ